MLYLDRLTIHNFKSFKHASIGFGKGFNCIVGPNGSGKSNICDALLFSLGETSLRRLRVHSAKNLINASAKPVKADGVKRAYVTVTFTGDETIDISRAIKSNNKIVYRINGKRATRQEVLDLLKGHKAEINETNTIAQGEIQRVLNLTPRERRGLIDVAAGIREFDDKKDTAMKELEKVQGKENESNIMLGERQAFLSELEKEKVDAERYLELSNMSKRISYTILKSRETQISGDYNKTVESYEKATNKKKELENHVKKLEDELSSAVSYKDNMSKKLNEGSIELATANKLTEEINSAIKLKESEIAHLKDLISKSKERIKSLKEESEQINAQHTSNTTELGSLKGDLAIKEKDLSVMDVDAGSSKELIVKYSEKQKELELVESRLSSLNAEYVSCNSELSRQEENLKGIKGRTEELEKKRADYTQELEQSKSRVGSLSQKLEKEKKALSGYQSEINDANKLIGEIDSEAISVRESLALSGRSTDRITPVLKAAIKKGFYGRAAELCSYAEKYAVAVNAASSNRLNYFVVDSIDVASEAIEIIKAKNLGRASFIPLKDVSAQPTEAKSGLKPLIEQVEFDDKYRAAFEYIFSNTYIIDKIKGAKAGKHRLVTLDGELIEQSGIVTGGRLSAQQMPAVLEAKLNKLLADKKTLMESIKTLEKDWEQKRRAVADMDIEAGNAQTSSKYIQSSIVEVEKELTELSKSSSGIDTRIAALGRSKEGFASKKIEIEKEKDVLKRECDNLYNALNKSPTDKKGAATKAAIEKAKSLRTIVEELKIKIASLDKENEIRAERLRSISKDLKVEEVSTKGAKGQITEAESVIDEQNKKRTEIQESIKNKSESSDSLLKQLQSSEEKIQKMGFERGKMSSDIEKIERELIELESRRSQMQTRLSDIKAELLSYSEIEQVQQKSIEELEKQNLESKHEMELLGNVNLKAPEAYTQRKKDVEEARQKLEILERERSSILGMIGEIESKKLSVFNETFAQVNENFKKLYSSIFDGSAYLAIDNTNDPFNARLQFNIQTGIKKHTEQELSGGQKSLVMLALILAIQMRKPMSFYIFDEIDVALDKENSKKLSKLIKELSKNSQFIVVSHNDSLITMAEAAIGVAMQENQSHAVGIEITNKR